MSPRFGHPRLARCRRQLAALAALSALAGAVVAHEVTGPEHAEGAGTANVIFILTDDQTYYELSAMPHVRQEIAAQGATFSRAYAPYPMCCPSRASLLTGQNMHNHGVRGNGGEFGGWARFVQHEFDALPVWLQDDGYYTVHMGKYLNGYLSNYGAFPPWVPPGWSEWYGKVSQPEIYYDYQLAEDPDGPGVIPAQYVTYGGQPEDYQTDVLRDKALDFIDGLPQNGGGPKIPFALDLWVNAPHAPFIPASRDFGTFGGVSLSKLPGFNEKNISDKPKWLRKQAHRLGPGTRAKIIQERRRRMEQLASVDDAVDQIVQALEDKGILDNTYLIFASDNGFFRGEHRIVGGKYLAYEPSSRVPLLIRGPGIPAGVTSSELVSTLDITQTILQIAQGSTDPSLDGRSLFPYAQDPSLSSTRPILLEADTGPSRGGNGDPASAEAAAGVAGKAGVKNLDQEPGVAASVKKATVNGNFAPAYRGLRTSRYSYVLYANGQSELYDMKLDPGQLHNVIRNRRYRRVRKWLFDHLDSLVTCKGAPCRAQAGPNPKPRPKHRHGHRP
jgi:N-acetylglucosamine-6-sulfatase